VVTCPQCWVSLDHAGQRHGCQPVSQSATEVHLGSGWHLLSWVLIGLSSVNAVGALVVLTRLLNLSSSDYFEVRDALGIGTWTLGTPGLTIALLVWVVRTRRAGALRDDLGRRLLPVVYFFGLASPVLLALAGSRLDGRLIWAAEFGRLISAVALVVAVLTVRREVAGNGPARVPGS
jgi:hypothetical protein